MSLFRRRDPYWEVDGRAARREQRSRKARSILAFVTALTAVAAAAFAWSIELGIAALLGIQASLPLG